MRRTSAALMCLVVGVGATALSVKYALPSGFNGSAKQEVFPLGDLDLGVIASNSVHPVAIELRNPTRERVFIFALERSCGCVGSDFLGGYLEAGESRTINLRIAPRQVEGPFLERVWLLASVDQFDGLGFEIRGRTVRSILLTQEPDFGEIHSELGGESSVQLSILGIDGIGETLANFSDELFRLDAQSYEGVFSVPLEDIRIDDAYGGGVLLSATIHAMASSYWGPIKGAQVVFNVPSDAGGGQFLIPIRGAFIPDIRVEHGPLFRTDTWIVDKDAEIRISLARGQEQAKEVEFPNKSGVVEGIRWSILEASDDWVLVLSPQETIPNFPLQRLTIPFLADGNAREVSLMFR